MKVCEKLVTILLDMASCFDQGVLIKHCVGSLEEVQKVLPYNAQLDISESSINTLVFNASAHHEGAWVHYMVTVQPTFLGLDISVVGLDAAEIAACVVDDFSTALTMDIEGDLKMEQTTIVVQRYRTPEGEPTCCEDLKERKFCKYLGKRNFGTEAVCMLGETKRLFDRDGYLQPHEDCEVWGDVKQRFLEGKFNE